MQPIHSSTALTLGRAVRRLFVSAFVIFTFLIYAVHERLVGPTQAAAANGLPAATPRAGAVVSTPNPTAAPIIQTTGPTTQPTAAPVDQNASPTAQPTAAIQPTPTVYIVQPGDTLDVIAQQFGVSVEAIMAANGIANPNALSSGQSLVIPAAATVPPTAAPTAAPTSPDATQPAVAQPTAVPASPTAASPTPAGRYKDGQYTGPQVDAYYGWVQVQAIIQNGQVSDVKFLQYPSDRRTSQRINSIAMPDLTMEAIQAQSASVDIISGATLTSQAFAQSLQSALQSATP